MTNIEQTLIGKRVQIGNATGYVVAWAESGLFYRAHKDDAIQFIPWLLFPASVKFYADETSEAALGRRTAA